jgi:hypothetical protein
MRSTAKTVYILGGAALCLAMVFQLRMVAAEKHSRLEPDEERYSLPPGEWMYALCLGFNEVTADLIWAKTLVYFGSQVSLKGNEKVANYTVNYLGVAAEMDPKFRRLYTTGSGLTLFQNRTVTKETVEMSIDLLEKGMEEFPNDGEIVFDLGFMHYYELRPFLDLFSEDPEAKAHRETGVRLLGRAALMPRVPKYAAGLAMALFKDEGLDDLAIEHAKNMLATEINPLIRKELEGKLRELLGKAAERDIEETKRFVRLWREEMPFVPYDHYLLLRSDFSYHDVIDPLAFSNGVLGIGEEEPETLAGADDRQGY